MKPEIRPLRPADMDSFVELCATRDGLDRAAAEKRAQVVEWVAFHNPEADGNPTYFVVDLGGRVMGHLGRMPTRFGVEGRPHRASYIHDLFVHPELQKGGRGFFLAMQMYRAAEQASPSFSVLVWTNEVNLGLQRARKYDELWVERYVKLLRADGPIDRVTGRITGRFGLGLVTRAGKPVASGFLGLADRVLGTALGRRRMQRVDHFDERFDVLAERLLPRLGIAPIKTRDYLTWKYYDRPQIQSAAYVALNSARAGAGAGELLGFTIVTAPGPKFRDSYVLELVADPEDKRTIVALAVQAAEHCRSMGAYSLECVAADPRFARVLRQLLFVPREPRYPLFRAGSDRYQHPDVLGRLENWHFSIGDSEGPV
jgi:GNAT superfamily N-acetyltransferase